MTPGADLSWWQRFKLRRALSRWRRSPVGQTLAEHTADYFETGSKLRFFEVDTKERLIGEFYSRVFALNSHDNPHAKFREELAAAVIAVADLQVLCLTEEEKAESFYSGARYVSGQLYHHIRHFVPHCDELGKFAWEHGDANDDDLMSFCNTRCALYLYHMNGFNLLRSEFGESLIKGKDWLRPFFLSAMIFSESTYRSKVGLPSLVPADDDLLPLEHSTFFTSVLECEPNPLYSWEAHYGKRHADCV